MSRFNPRSNLEALALRQPHKRATPRYGRPIEAFCLAWEAMTPEEFEYHYTRAPFDNERFFANLRATFARHARDIDTGVLWRGVAKPVCLRRVLW